VCGPALKITPSFSANSYPALSEETVGGGKRLQKYIGERYII
jgi:hypothetical protein